MDSNAELDIGHGPTAIDNRGPIQTRFHSERSTQKMLDYLNQSPNKKPLFLETNHFRERQDLIVGMVNLVRTGFELSSEIEDPRMGIPDETFQNCRTLFRGLEQLVLPRGENRAFRIKRRPTAFIEHDSSPVVWDAAHLSPTVTNYWLTRANGGSLPEVLGIEIMPDSYRRYGQGFRSLEGRVLDGAHPEVARQALIDAHAPGHRTQQIIESRREKLAYVQFSAGGVSVRFEDTNTRGLIQAVLELPRPLPYLNGPQEEPDLNVPNIVNRSTGSDISTVQGWRGKEFTDFLQTLNRSLIATFKKHRV